MHAPQSLRGQGWPFAGGSRIRRSVVTEGQRSKEREREERKERDRSRRTGLGWGGRLQLGVPASRSIKTVS